jgi:K+-sensing histidine kinase KdpD
MAHGNIYTPEKVDAALGNYFRIGNLTRCASWLCCGWRTR